MIYCEQYEFKFVKELKLGESKMHDMHAEVLARRPTIEDIHKESENNPKNIPLTRKQF